ALRMPVLTGVFAVVTFAALGLPGLNSFVGEFMTLLGAWQRAPALAAFAAVGLILAPVYMLRLFQGVTQGAPAGPVPKSDIRADLVLPRSRRGGVVAMFAVVGFAYSLGVAVYRWLFASGDYAYHRFATGDYFALFFEVLFASLGILTVALSHSYLRRRGLLES